ncbi:MAG: hypothetical protein U1E65_31445 [Myxococcota bacterium]
MGRLQIVLALSFTLLACQPKGAQSPAYKQALVELEEAIVETHDHEYLDPRFDALLAKLRAIPDDSAGSVAALINDIESTRSAARRSKSDLNRKLEQAAKDDARRAAQAASSLDSNPVQFNIPSDSRPAVRPYEPPDQARQNFDREADAARQRNLAASAQQEANRAAEREAETQRKMQERLEEKKRERMDQPLDSPDWKCQNGICKSTVRVTRDEVK